MGKCDMCKIKTDKKVLEASGEMIYLCEDCQSKFEQCKVCKDFYFGFDLENGVCEYCKEE